MVLCALRPIFWEDKEDAEGSDEEEGQQTPVVFSHMHQSPDKWLMQSGVFPDFSKEDAVSDSAHSDDGGSDNDPGMLICD